MNDRAIAKRRAYEAASAEIEAGRLMSAPTQAGSLCGKLWNGSMGGGT